LVVLHHRSLESKKVGNAHFFRTLARGGGGGKFAPPIGGRPRASSSARERANRLDDGARSDALLAARRPALLDLDHALLCEPVAVGAHDDRALLPRLVEVLRVQPLGVLGAELEDVADLDDALDLERLAALPARLAGGHRVQIDEARLEVAPRNDAAQVEALAV